MKRLFYLLSLLTLCVNISSAQSYTHSVGAVLGSYNGISYKMMPSSEVAVQLDLAQKFAYCTDFSASFPMFSVELAPSIMRVWPLGSSRWNYFFGGGVVMGYNWWLPTLRAYKFGINLITGAEYHFPDSPVALQLDFRPGYSLLFKNYVYGACFDWGLNCSIRYTF